MAAQGFLLIATFLLVLMVLARPLGSGLARLINDIPLPGTTGVERVLFRALGVSDREMNWKQYLCAILGLNMLGLAVLFFMLLGQHYLPLNPQQLPGLSWDLALNTAVSFVTNTNWQSYSGETTLSYFSQMAGLTVQNFLSAASGIAVIFALIRAFTRQSMSMLGNAWVDLLRITLWVLVPVALLIALFFIQQGALQNFLPYQAVNTVEGAQQLLPMGPVASQEAIKMLGTNGGGFFNANSSHPFENPTALTNFVQMLAIFLIPTALCFAFGEVTGDRRQGRMLLWAMSVIFVICVGVVMWAEVQGNPHLLALGTDSSINMEGKESRFGVLVSSLFAVVTTAASCGAVIAMHDSFTALGGMVPMWLMQIGEVVFGGVGSGLYGMMLFVLLAVFIAGLMIGRTPEYLGKKIDVRKRQAYRGRHISEFDLDAALARRPALILMDELAHSNAPGSRHPKRWQDIEELLEAGIDVFTTVNVQHLESLNDVVSGVTGIQVRETVPDPFFDAADDVVLVDLPPDDLRQRLKEGKVYIAGQAERAIEHFFRKGNLIALRELALRRTADRVDEQMRAWRGHPSEEKVWHTRDAILLCIGHNTGSEKLVRAAARLASRLGSVWHAVYVETPALHRLPEKKRRAILSALRLAQELGAETATLSDPAEEKAVVRYAREHNLGKIILGRPASRRWWRRETFADRLARIAPDLDQVLVALDEPPARTINNAPDNRSFKDKWRVQIQGCVVAAALCAVITLIAMQWLMAFDAANLVMLYLLGVVVVALFYGRWPSVVATVINVVSFDLFFIAPRGTLAVSDVQYLLTFAVMLTVGLVIGNLTAGVRYQHARRL